MIEDIFDAWATADDVVLHELNVRDAIQTEKLSAMSLEKNWASNVKRWELAEKCDLQQLDAVNAEILSSHLMSNQGSIKSRKEELLELQNTLRETLSANESAWLELAIKHTEIIKYEMEQEFQWEAKRESAIKRLRKFDYRVVHRWYAYTA